MKGEEGVDEGNVRHVFATSAPVIVKDGSPFLCTPHDGTEAALLR